MPEKIYWVYILLCTNQNYYTGYTNDLEKRFQAHLSGKASKYTRSFKPLFIAQSWQISGKINALRIERYIKTLSKTQKEKLIKNPDLIHENTTL